MPNLPAAERVHPEVLWVRVHGKFPPDMREAEAPLLPVRGDARDHADMLRFLLQGPQYSIYYEQNHQLEAQDIQAR